MSFENATNTPRAVNVCPMGQRCDVHDDGQDPAGPYQVCSFDVDFAGHHFRLSRSTSEPGRLQMFLDDAGHGFELTPAQLAALPGVVTALVARAHVA